MTERVVDILEAVEIETEHCHQMAVAFGPRYGAVEMLAELEAIGQAGEGIVHGEIANLIFGQPALANAPRGDGRGYREPHDDQQAGGERDHSSARLVSAAAADWSTAKA